MERMGADALCWMHQMGAVCGFLLDGTNGSGVCMCEGWSGWEQCVLACWTERIGAAACESMLKPIPDCERNVHEHGKSRACESFFKPKLDWSNGRATPPST